MPSRALAATTRFGLGALGIAMILAACSGASMAQPKPDAGPAGAPASASGAATAQPKPAAAPAASEAAQLDKGRDIFSNYGCGSCHSLGDAGTTGHVGPALDGNANLSQDFIVNRVTNGQGMMPSFGAQLSADEINTLASYIMKVSAPPK